MGTLAITLLGFNFSGTMALAVLVVIVAIVGLISFGLTRPRRN